MVRVDPIAINRQVADHVKCKEKDSDGFDQCLGHPCGIVSCIKNAIFLPNKVNLGEESVEIFVGFVFIR